MPSLLQGFECDIFISYRQNDNKRDGWVTEFVNTLKNELDATIKDKLNIYFDENPDDGLHEHHEVDESLREKLKCLIFIPIVSQTYCDPEAFAWKNEFKVFLEQAGKDQFGLKTKLSNGNVANRILVVKIHDLDPKDIEMFESEVGGVMRSIDFIYKDTGVNRPLSPEDSKEENLNKFRYKDQVNKVANALKEIMYGMSSSDSEIATTLSTISFTEKIKHRNVLWSGIVYILVALLAWKIAEVGIRLLNLDYNILNFITLGLVILFPIATLMAWLYERSPQGFIRTSSFASVLNPLSGSQKKPLTSSTFITLLTLTVIALFLLFPNRTLSDNDTADSNSPDSVKSIAVLPFVNMSNDPDQEYFSDGISEELISALAKVEHLKVAGRTSSFSFKGKSEDLKIIGEKLGVNSILEGSVRKAGNTVRIMAQLVNVKDGYQLWTETYERELDNIFSVQDDIAISIMEALKVHLEPEVESRIKITETGTDAYDLYLQGRQKLAKRDELFEARKLFEQVIKLDQDYSPAYSGLARTLSVIPFWTLTLYQEISEDCLQAATKALELDSLNAEAYSTLGTYYLNFKNWELAQKYHEKAILLKPNDAEMINFIGDYYRYVWHPDMVKFETKALELDRLYYNNHLEVGTAYLVLQDWSNAIIHSSKALSMDSTNMQAIIAVFRALIEKGQLQEADKFLSEYPALDDQVELSLNLCKAWLEAMSGDRDKALHLTNLSEAIVKDIGSYSSVIALIYFELNMLEEAAQWIEFAYESQDHMINILTLPEDYPDHPALAKSFNKPEMKNLYEIRRENRALWK